MSSPHPYSFEYIILIEIARFQWTAQYHVSTLWRYMLNHYTYFILKLTKHYMHVTNFAICDVRFSRSHWKFIVVSLQMYVYRISDISYVNYYTCFDGINTTYQVSSDDLWIFHLEHDCIISHMSSHVGKWIASITD